MILSAPSYVIPGTYAENLRFLAAKPGIRGVELLFYIWNAETRELLDRESKEIQEYGGRFRYTAHLPDPLGPEHREVVAATEGFVQSYVAHPPMDAGALSGFVDLMDAWRRDFGDRFFLENIRLESFHRARAALPDMPLCVDVGHILVEGQNPAALIARLLEEGRRLEELHLHGLLDGSDHRSFGADAPWLCERAPFLRGFRGVAEIELFSWAEVEAAIEAIGTAVNRDPIPQA